MRLVDADELLKKTIPKNPDAKFHCVPVEDIKAAPTIEPEREKGRWMFEEYPDGYYHSRCSECEAQFPEEAYIQRWHFCPNCSSDMREEGGE